MIECLPSFFGALEWTLRTAELEKKEEEEKEKEEETDEPNFFWQNNLMW